MNLLGIFRPQPKINDIDRGLLETALFTAEQLTERIASLELALEDQSWTQFSITGNAEFSREGLGKITDISRLMYLKNPIINRGVEVKRLYVWGNGININAEDDDINTVIQDFMDDTRNQAEITSHQAQTLKEVDLETDGNLFFVFFVDDIATGEVVVRSIPFDEIKEIICNPEDAKEPWYYHRQWTKTNADGTQKINDEYYPDWNFAKPEATLNSKTVNVSYPICHVKIGGFSTWKFGVSEVYSAIDWAKAYKAFLENWATIAQALARFAWKITTTGGKAGIAAAKSKVGTTLGTGSGETNPPPVTGAAFIRGVNSADLDPIRTAGVQASAEDGRRILLMACAGLGLPETFLGDASVGSLATAKSLDRPTELMMLDRQMLWSDVFRKIITFVLKQNVKAGGDLATMATINANGNLEWNEGVDKTININFPPLMSNDVTAQVQAIFQANQTQTLDARTIAQLLLAALSVEEADEVLTKLYPTDEVNAPVGSVAEAIRTFTEGLREVMAK
jgi:hypothetical protein